MLDLVITGGLVLDGTGAPAVPADVGVAGGRIVEIGRLAGVRATRTIRADGRIVCPGFIDMHAHDDFNLPVNPLAAEKTRQGVTTLVTGNCGLSPAPLGPGASPGRPRRRRHARQRSRLRLADVRRLPRPHAARSA